MTKAYVDTNVLVRFLTNDDAAKQQRSAALFRRVEQGDVQLTTPSSAIAEVVYILSSSKLYNKPRSEVVRTLLPLVKLPSLKLYRRNIIVKALALFESTKLNFGDAMIAADVLSTTDKPLYSFDEGFDKIPDIKRIEP